MRTNIFWKDKKVLLTGHTGFKGTWMSIMLNALGAKVCGYSLPLSEASFYCQAGVNIYRHCEGDIADKRTLEKVIDEFKPEIIIHLASHSSLDGSDRIPEFILKTNIMGVVNLLDICRNREYTKSIVVVTSDKCYRNLETEEPYTEDCELGGEDPYSVSKVCQELITRCYEKTFFKQNNVYAHRTIGIATARASNVIGVGDYNITRLIPYVLDNFKNGNLATIRNPKAVRPWQYVLDVTWGYILLAEKLYENNGNYNDAYNFGPDENGFKEVGELVQVMSKEFPKSKYVFGEIKRSVQRETKILKLDSTKAKSLLNWKALYSIEDMAKEISSIINQEMLGKDIKSLCENAVHEYLKKVVHDEL